MHQVLDRTDAAVEVLLHMRFGFTAAELRVLATIADLGCDQTGRHQGAGVVGVDDRVDARRVGARSSRLVPQPAVRLTVAKPARHKLRSQKNGVGRDGR